MISDTSLTATQRVVLSNTICGELQAACELEEMGLLRIRRIEQGNREVLAFFDLTQAGEVFVNRHFIVPDSLKPE